MYRRIPLFSALLLCACTLVPDSPDTSRQTEQAALPYPDPGVQEPIALLSLQLSRLEQQIDALQNRLRQPEQQQTTPKPRLSARATGTVQTAGPAKAAAPQDELWQQAQNAYRQKQYQTAAQLLASYDNGGSGSEADRQKMQLLLQSQEKTGNCQSVINIGERYARLFAGQSGAADALYLVGLCQWQIQQRDIARDTWRLLMRSYPQSGAAKRAAERINSR